LRLVLATINMGAGASTGKGKPKAVDGTALLKKAQDSAEEAAALFGKIDKNGDGKLTCQELMEGVTALKKEQKAEWSEDVIKAVVEFYDRDADGKLDLDEFTFALSELKERGHFDAGALMDLKKERDAAQAESKAEFDKYAKEGVFDKSSMGKLIRAKNDDCGYWDDFGSQVTKAHAALTGDESRKATATFEQFAVWYPTLLAEIATIKAGWAAAETARTEGLAAAKAEEFKEGKPEWEVHMKRLSDAIAAATAQGKTPLLVDVTTPAGENKNAGFSPLENFYSYSGNTLIELKKAVVETGVKKEKTVEEVQKEFAKKLLLSLKQGRELILLCSNSAPPMKSKFAADIFPMDILDAAAVKPLLAEDAKLEGSMFDKLLQHLKDEGLDKDPTYNVVVAHKDFKVVVVTKFEPDDYKGFLEDEFPFDKLQPIKVFTD